MLILRLATTLLFVVIAANTIRHADAQTTMPVSVETSLGQVVGLSDGSVDSFLGIQYATVGPRFSRSTLIQEPWQEQPLNATTFGPWCWQALPPGSDETASLYTMPPQDEECLYLNIWRPVNATNTSTMFYIHGGGFNFGSAAEPAYNGASLARDYNVVVVSANYRLGLFGFLVTGENGYGGLNGIHDIIHALEWVQQHLESFGGNPNDVTIFGESAGSMAVCMLNVSPLAEGLFHRSIQQSGECAVGFSKPNTPQVGAQNAKLILQSLNVSSVDELANATLYPAQDIAPYSSKQLIGWHTVDNWVLPKQPEELYSDSNNIVPTDIMIGSNTYDAPQLLVIPPIPYIAMAMNMETELYAIFGPDFGAAILQAYSLEYYNGNAVAAYSQFWGDFTFRCGTRQFAALVANHVSGKAYLYNYAYLSSVDPIVLSGLQDLANISDASWATHAADVPMIFGTLIEFAQAWSNDGTANTTTMEPTMDDWKVSEEMKARWIQFAKTGNPNTDEYPGWTPVPQGQNVPGPSATFIPSYVFGENSTMREIDTNKVEQCSVFGFSPAASQEPGDTPADDNGMTSGSISLVAEWVIVGSTVVVVVMDLFQGMGM